MPSRKVVNPLLQVLLVAATALSALVGCEKDPNDAQTWIDQLDDRAKLNEALRHLEHLDDPKAIKPLGETWKATNKQSQVLRTLINIAGHVDEKTGKAQWADALPYLTDAVENFDPGSRRSIDDARVACDALGRAKDPSTVKVLIAAAQKPLPKLHEGNHVRIAAIQALGKFHEAAVIDVLITILQADPDRQLVRLNAAAALALAETGDPKALPALTRALFLPVYRQVRTSITRVGKPAVPAMIALFQGKNAEIQQLAKEKDFEKKGPGQVAYKSALILGDLRANEAVQMLKDALKTEPKIAFFDERTGAPGPTTHQAILDALRHIASPEAAPAVKAYWMDPKTDDGIRPVAIDVYSMLTSETSALPDLLKIIKDEQTETQIRFAAIIAYGRLARTAEQVKPINDLIASYDEKIKKAEEKMKSGKSDQEKAVADDERQAAAVYKDALTETKNRASIGVECGDDPACYAKTLEVKDLSPGQPGLPRAERALIELTKMGQKATGVTDQLLAHVDSTVRFVREGILLALPRVAPDKCKKCADRLDHVIDSQSEDTTLDLLTEETRVVYHYFLSTL